MPIPDFQNLMLPMLEIAADGSEHRLAEMIEALAQQFQLSDDERAELLPSGGQARFENKVGWARTHLGKALLVESKRRGWFCITERGQELLGDPPERITMAYLMRYPEYLAFRNNGRAGEPGASSLDIEDQAQDQEPAAPETPVKTNTPEQQQGLTALQAAYEVLKEAGEPLNASELSRRMLSQGLWSTKGATPGQTVASSIAIDIQANVSSP